MEHLTEEEKAELLEDAGSVELRQDFAAMSMRSKRLSPLEWLDFLTQMSNLTGQTRRKVKIMKGDNFLL